MIESTRTEIGAARNAERIRATAIIAGWDEETAEILAAAGIPPPLVTAMFLQALEVVN